MKFASFILALFSLSAFADHFVVEMKQGFKNQDLKRLKQYPGVVEISKFTDYKSEYFDRLFSVEVKNKTQIEKIKADNSVALVEADFKPEYFEIRINPNSKMIFSDMLIPQQWGLFNQNQVIEKRSLGGKKIYVYADLNMDINWHEHIDNVEKKLKKSPVVAVVDMGIDFEHPDLKHAIAYNKKECDENNTVPVTREDLDGNQLPADCHGWNFAATSPEFQQYPKDDKGHGTHVSGIIAAKRDNEIGIGGVSDKIKILPVRVTGRVDETADRNRLLIKAPSKRIANGILYAVRMNVDVINLSLGWPKTLDTNFMRQVIAEAIKKDIVVVAAAGNDNSSGTIYPCNYYDVICVGSVDIDGNMSDFSNHGGQVDVLAPGDQIVSTIPTPIIPLKLNIQGYDIYSGTSQAAPFVSATAALLKGVNPDIKLDEIKRRLFTTTQTKKNPTKSIGGMIDFGASFTEPKGAAVLPVFKELKTVEVDSKNGIFKFPVYLKNYGENSDKVVAKVTSLTDGIEILAANPATKVYEMGKPAPIYVTGQVKDFSSDRNLNLELTVDVDGKVDKYYHTLTLGLNIAAVPMLNFGFKFRDKAKPVIVLDKETNRYKALLDTVDEKYEAGSLPSYYLIKSNMTKEEKSIHIDIFHFDGRGFREAKNEFYLKDTLKFLSITKHDYNYDGQKDILIKSIRCRKECEREIIPEEDLYIAFSYRNLDFEPLFGEYSDIEFTADEKINLTPKTVRHYKLALPNGMTMAAPYFVTEGVIPDDNEKLNPVTPVAEDDVAYENTYFEDNFILDIFKPKRKRIRRRLYYLTLDSENKKFVSKTFMDQKFDLVVRTKMEKVLNKRVSLSDAYINIVQSLHQSEEDYNNDNVHVMFAFGLGGYQYHFIVEIHDNKYRIIPATDIDRPLLGNSHHKYFELTDKTDKSSSDTFVNFLTSNLITVTGVKGSNEQVVLPYRLKRDDIINSFIAFYDYGDKHSMFLEHVDTISLVTQENGEIKESFSPTEKFSFLSGTTMSDLYYPVVVRDRASRSLAPAIYIDNTAISSDQIYLQTEVNGNLIAPVRTSFYIPNNCKARTPILGKDGNYLFALICQDENGFRLKYIDMIK